MEGGWVYIHEVGMNDLKKHVWHQCLRDAHGLTTLTVAGTGTRLGRVDISIKRGRLEGNNDRWWSHMRRTFYNTTSGGKRR